MSIKDAALNIIIRAKDLTGGVLGTFKRGLKDTEKAADSTQKRIVALAKSFGALIGAAVGFTAIKNGMLAILTTGDKFERLGIQLNTMMGSVEAGEAAFEWVRAFTKNTPLQLAQTTDAFVKLKAFGIDPMDGSLQSIVDQNEALGGGMDRLGGLILAVGKSFSKGKIEAEEWNMLTERGVNLSALFQEALGKTESEILALRKAGALGRDEIGKLIATMGESTTGAAAANMQTLTGLVSNLKDSWDVFLNTIAESGAMDSVREQLQALAAKISALTASGDLAAYAKRISDAMASMVSGIVSAGATVVTFSAELALLAKAFVAIKLVTLTASIVGMGKQMIVAAANTKLFSGAAGTAATAVTKLQTAFLGVQAFLVGWEIGSYLREKFTVVETLSNTLVGGLLKSWATLALGWESLKAAFTADTVEAATARWQAKIDDITTSTRILNEEAEKSAGKLEAIGLKGAAAVEKVAAVVDATAAAITDTAETAEDRLNSAFKTLDVNIDKVNDGISKTGQQALDAFNAISDAEQEMARDSEVASRSIAESYLAAFKEIETEAGKAQLLKGLQAALEKGLISFKDYEAAIKETGQATEVLATQFGFLEEKAKSASKSLRDAADSAKQMGQDVEQGATQGASAAGLMSGAIEGYTHQMEALGEGAKDAFEQMALGMKPPQEESERLHDRLQALGAELQGIREQGLKLSDTSGLQGYLRGLRETAREVEVSFIEQKLAAQDLFASYEEGSVSAALYIQKAERMIKSSQLLDKQDLGNLTRGIEAARQAMDRLNESTRNTVSSLQNELDQLQGNTEAVEQRQYQQRVSDLEGKLKEAQYFKNQQSIDDLQQSLKIAKAIYDTEKQNRAEAARERAAQQAERAESTAKPEKSRTASSARTSSNSNNTQTINLQVGGQSVAINTDNPDGLLDLLTAAGLTTS